MKNFIELTLVSDEKVQLRVSNIGSVIKKIEFDEDDISRFPKLKNLEECAYVSLIGDITCYRVIETYEKVMGLIEQSSL